MKDQLGINLNPNWNEWDFLFFKLTHFSFLYLTFLSLYESHSSFSFSHMCWIFLSFLFCRIVFTSIRGSKSIHFFNMQDHTLYGKRVRVLWKRFTVLYLILFNYYSDINSDISVIYSECDLVVFTVLGVKKRCICCSNCSKSSI